MSILPIKVGVNLCNRATDIKDYKCVEIRGKCDINAPPIDQLALKLNQQIFLKYVSYLPNLAQFYSLKKET